MAITKLNSKSELVRGHKNVQRIAKQFHEMPGAPGDRGFRESRRDKIASAITERTFRVGNFASVHCKQNGITYRANGKHTSRVITELNGKTPDDLEILVERYEADTLQDVAQLYATFDQPWSVRNTCDINRAFAGAIEDLHGVPSRIINLAVTGIAIVESNCNAYSTPVEVRAAALNENAEFVLWLNDMIGKSTKESSYLRRSAVVAAMYATWRKAKKAATQFWTLVLNATGPEKTSPDRVLNFYLVTHVLRNSKDSKPVGNAETPRSMFCRCIHAWNAWRKGKTTELRYFPAVEIPSAV